MKAAYPIVMTKGDRSIVVYVPDFQLNTQGEDYAGAMAMARDAVGLIGIDLEDDGEQIPAPTDLAKIAAANPEAVVTLVDVDFAEYRRKNDMRTVRRNVSLPSWLNAEADRANLNVSAILQDALKKKLGIKRSTEKPHRSV